MPDTPSPDTRTQKEKMEAGDPYIANDAVLAQAQRRAYVLSRRYEQAYLDDPARADLLLRELLDHVGDEVHIRPPFLVDYGCYIRIGARTFANYGLVALDVARITIGEDVQIGPNVQLLTPTHPVDPEPRRAKFEAARPIIIGNNVWLGGGAIVMPGVTIGDNSVIGAGAVVTRDVPANVVAVGNPARVLRHLVAGEPRPVV